MYKADVLTGPREQTEDITLVERFIGSGNEIEAMYDAEQFCAQYGELSRVYRYVDGSADLVAQRAYDLYKRHAQQILGVIDDAAKQTVADMRRDTLPKTCLISIVCGRVAREAPRKKPQAEYQFEWQGEMWFVRFENEEGYIKNGVGVWTLVELLAKPNPAQPLLARHLLHLSDTEADSVEQTYDGAIDKEGLNRIYQRYQDIQSEIDRAKANQDFAAVQRLETEKSEILKQVKAGTYRGRAKDISSASRKKKAEKRIRMQLSRLRDQLIKNKLPSLAEHLATHIDSSHRPFAYRPGPSPPNWTLSRPKS